MRMEIELTDVKPSENYTLLLTFSNGEVRRFDMKPYLDLEMFSELKNLKIFNSVRKSFDTIQWDNEADIDPDILYNESKIIDSNSVLS
jgi:hypothetical protein